MFRKRTDTPEAFWKWFTSTDRTRTDAHELLRKVVKRVKHIHPALTIEVATAGEPRELVFSADGVREAAQFVDAIVDAAPLLPGWTFTRFRPRHPIDEDISLDYGGVRHDIGSIRVGAVPYESLVDLHVFVPWRDDPAQREPDGPTFIALDMALGEWMMMTCIGEITVRPLAQAPRQTVPLNRLHELVQAVLDR